MQPISLNDIVPQEATFSLQATNETYTIRPFSIDDELWLQRTFGNELERIFKEVRMEAICRIAFRQLVEEDKKKFATRTVKFTNEEGEEAEHQVGGYRLLLCFISGWGEKVEIITALTQAIGVSRKMLDQITEEEKKRTEKPRSTGEPSSIDSVLSTDGPQSIAEA